VNTSELDSHDKPMVKAKLVVGLSCMTPTEYRLESCMINPLIDPPA